MRQLNHGLFILAASLAAGAGCAKETAAKKEHGESKTQVAPVATPTAGATMSAEVLLRTRAALSYYEAIRAALASDDLKPVAQAAEKLADVAKIAGGKASGGSKDALEGIAKSAQELKGKSDIEAARLAFGELSKYVIALVAGEPELKRDRHVFECPMAKGYKKWVQTKTSLENPYMGKKMLDCGSKTEWKS